MARPKCAEWIVRLMTLAYQEGRTTYEIGEAFSYGHASVSRLLCEAGVVMRDGGKPPADPMTRFLSHLPEERGEDVCWPFQGFVDPREGVGGYGQFALDGKRSIGAHVASYILHYGKVPRGKLVMHECNNRACVNPKHLKAGTQKQNMEHCVATRRVANGERQGRAVLTEDRVRALRLDRASGMKVVDLAEKFGISIATVSQIIRRVTWRHVA